MTVQSWLASALSDAERRGLSELRPLLEMLARATEGVRRADAALPRPRPPESEPR